MRGEASTSRWDLAKFLDVLLRPPFEPMQLVELKMLSIKAASVLALASAKRGSDIHELSVTPSCQQFVMGDVKVLKPSPAFML